MSAPQWRHKITLDVLNGSTPNVPVSRQETLRSQSFDPSGLTGAVCTRYVYLALRRETLMHKTLLRHMNDSCYHRLPLILFMSIRLTSWTFLFPDQRSWDTTNGFPPL